MRKINIQVELSSEQIEALERCLKCINKCVADGTFPAVDPSEALTLASLTRMLLSDVAYTMTRPGSWEGSNMINVLRSHGYDIWC